METAKQRIIGFDLARAYAIFGMYIVNYNIVFGNYYDTSLVGKILSLFSGNSSTVFVMLAGMGVALMTNRSIYTAGEKKQLRAIINKRAWFLFALGLLLFLWWPADILHFYGGYMHIAAIILFFDKKVYLYAAAGAILIFHILLVIIPYETGWNFETLQYTDFWTIEGFIRNTFYNGWNAIFPWLAYFTVGMYLGRLDWSSFKLQKRMFILGLMVFASVNLVQVFFNQFTLSDDVKFYLTADYLPPFLPFVLSTLGFGLMLISVFMWAGQRLSNNTLAQHLAKTGQMTLTHYISHLTIGMLLLSLMTNRTYTTVMNESEPIPPMIIFLFATGYFILSYFFSKWWASKYKNGPFEMLMRKISD